MDIFPNVKRVTIGWREEDMVANNGRVPEWMELGEGAVLLFNADIDTVTIEIL